MEKKSGVGLRKFIFNGLIDRDESVSVGIRRLETRLNSECTAGGVCVCVGGYFCTY